MDDLQAEAPELDEDDQDDEPSDGLRIKIREHGPYRVSGKPRLTRRRIVRSEQDESIAWEPEEGTTEADWVVEEETFVLCRCGQSQDKPFCDGSHHEVHFAASGEPATGKADMLPVRDGTLAIDPQVDGPLKVRGNMEIISGTGRVVARLESATLCRCGASNNKPFCDGSHARVGFRSG